MCNLNYLDYSVDKIKLYIHGIKLGEVQKFMNILSLDMHVSAYESKSITACRYNYIIKEEDKVLFNKRIKGSSFYLGIEPNWSKDRNKTHRDIILEYNPNKISLHDFEVLAAILPIDEYRTEIMSMDIAIDIFNNHLQDLIIYKRHGHEHIGTIAHSKLETVYIGAFGANGHIKIYDKAKEQNITDLVWTRYEITYKKLGFLDIRDTEVIENTKLVDVKIKNDNLNLDELKGTEKYIMLTSIDNIDKLSMLGRVMKKKILSYHNEYFQNLNIELSEIIKTYKNFKVI